MKNMLLFKLCLFVFCNFYSIVYADWMDSAYSERILDQGKILGPAPIYPVETANLPPTPPLHIFEKGVEGLSSAWWVMFKGNIYYCTTTVFLGVSSERDTVFPICLAK